jgi:deoxyribose-phosphate aldolase
MTLAGMIDQTVLKADATATEIQALCQQAREFSFASVCVNPIYVSLAAKLVASSSVKVCTVVGFPLGATTTQTKVHETRQAVAEGADEIDMVLALGALKSGDDTFLNDDLQAVRQACQGKTLKVILETCLLNDEQKIKACLAIQKSGAEFVKTSTGFSSGGATLADVRLLRKTVGPTFGVKASGGIRDRQTALDMVAAGATRLGTSAGHLIVRAESASGGSGIS